MSDQIIQLNQDLIHTELKDLVKNSVEETLNSLLDAEADRLVNAERYARDEERTGYRAGHYDRSLTTAAGKVNLRMPKLKGVTFETAIIERYRRRETSVEEALIEMYLAGVSVRRVEDITEALWGTKVSPGTISKLNKKAYENIEQWRNRPITTAYPYVYVDGIFLKRCWGENYENVSILIAVGVSEDGYREIIGAAEGLKEDLTSWKNFFVWLKQRGLDDTRLIIGETRGAEAGDWLTCLNTGHDGSLGTAHANSVRDMIGRLEMMVLSGIELPIPVIRRQIASGIEIMVHLVRDRTGKRMVDEIAEVTGIVHDEVQIHTIYKRSPSGILEKKGTLQNREKWEKRYAGEEA